MKIISYRLSHLKTTTAAAWIGKGITVSLKFVSLPLLINYLGINEYALFVLITSLEQWFFFLADLGVGSCIQNFLSEQKAQNLSSQETRNVTAHLSLLSILFILPVSVFVISQPFLFGELRQHVTIHHTHLMKIAAIFYVLGTWGSLSYRSLFAAQKGALVYFFQTLGGVISFCLLFFLCKNYQGKDQLLYSLVITIGAPTLLSSGLFYVYFLKEFKFLHFSLETFRKIIKRSLKFWLLALLSTLILCTDYFFMAKTLRAEEITLYSVLSKLFSVAFFTFHTILSALWPTFSEHLVRKEWNSVHKFLKPTCLFGFFLIFICTFGIFLFKRELALYFFKSPMEISGLTLLLFGLFSSIRVFTDTFAVVHHSRSHLRIFFYLLPFQALLSCSLQYLFSREWGIDGILIGLITSFLMTVTWGLPFEYYRVFKKFKEQVRWS